MPHFINHKNTQIAYSLIGRGRAVVLLHGFLENATMWNTFIPELSKRNKVITIDLLGHGTTGNLGYVHGMEEQAQAVKAVLRHLRLRKYILIGHSMGGYVALAFAELFPNTIKGLCLMNSTAVADTAEKKQNRERAIEAVKKNRKTFISMAIPNLFAEKNRADFSNEILQITNEALALSPQNIIASLEGMKIRKNRSKMLYRKGIQKMLIIGKKDPVLNYQSLIKQTKGMDVKIIELEGGHMSHIENKIALLSSLKDFVKSCN